MASYGIKEILNFSNLGEEDISIPLDQDKCSINISISHSFEEFELWNSYHQNCINFGKNDFSLDPGLSYQNIQYITMTKNITDGNFDQNFEEGSATINIELHPSLADLTGRSTYQVGWKIDPTNPSNYIQLQNESGNDTLNEKNFLLDFEVSLFENNDNELFYYELYNVRKPLNVSYLQLNTGNAFEDTFSSTCTGQGMSITYDLATNFINQTSEPPVCGQLATTILYPNGLKEDNQFVSIYGQSPNEIKVEDISGEMTIRYNSISPERNEYAAIIELDHGEVVSIEFEKNDVNWDEYEVGDLNTEISQLSSSSLMVTSFVFILFLRKIKSRK